MELHILDQTKSIANHYLAEIRDVSIQKDRMRFRKNLERLGFLMAYEFSKALEFSNRKVTTPLGVSPIEMIQNKLYLITVLRAGLPFYNGFQEVFDRADSGFIGAYRANENAEKEQPDIQLDYLASDDLTGKELLLIDPMLATGNSLIKSYQALIKKNGTPKKVHFFSVIGTPHAIQNIRDHLNVAGSIWVGSVDQELNDLSYIIPGLGDAGDLSFGKKL